jgi:penicillin-binding protein activator
LKAVGTLFWIRRMNMIKRELLVSIAVCSLVALTGCKTKVTRLEAGEVRDLSGRWNDSDSQMVAEEMITDLANRPWIEMFSGENGRKPVVIVGTIRNKSSEHINTEPFTKELEKELVNNGRVTFVANPLERGELRAERKEQQTWSREETQKRLAAETGADYMLQGGINSIVDREGKESIIYYQVELELVHLESNEKAWIGSHKIKKYIKRAKLNW